MKTGMRQIVIEIDETKYNTIMNYPKEWDEWALNAIKHGTPLPKGHGDLKDIDDIYEVLEGWNEDTNWIVDTIGNLAPTIIEADKEIKNVKNADSN